MRMPSSVPTPRGIHPSIHPIILPTLNQMPHCNGSACIIPLIVEAWLIHSRPQPVSEQWEQKFALFPRRYELPLHPQLLEGMDQNLLCFSEHHILLGVKHTGQHLHRCWTNICSQNVLRSSVPRSIQACLQTRPLVFRREQALETKQCF